MHENGWNRSSWRDNEERGWTLEEFQEVLRSVVGPDMEESLPERFFNEVHRNKGRFNCVKNILIPTQ